MNKPYAVKDLLIGAQSYSIPLYQRNFAWTFDEIAQLIIDVLDSIKSKRANYYIGTLVISNKNNVNSIIDGQQRFTALLLTSLAVQNRYSDNLKNSSIKRIEEIPLNFEARESSQKTFDRILKNEILNEDNEISRGYQNALEAIKTYVINDPEYTQINIEDFYNYLLHHVQIFVSTMPKDLDLNLYFERFNSRGEQLEFHEILKAELMQKLLVEKADVATINKFAKIWDACSEFNTPVINFFKKKVKRADEDAERENIFRNIQEENTSVRNSWLYRFDLHNVYAHVENKIENRKSIFDVIRTDEIQDKKNYEPDDELVVDERERYRTIINFNTFLYYALYITCNETPDNIQLDDKKLQSAFSTHQRSKEWILTFGLNLIKLKFIFDNLIIRNSLETTTRRKEGDWFLQKAYRVDKNEKYRGHLYVQTRFDKNAFKNKNEDILMIQSMFAVTFTAYKDTRWLYTTLKYLFDNAADLNDDDFGTKFLLFLEGLSKNYARKRFVTDGKIDEEKLRYDEHVPVYAFNFTDYILWKNRSELKTNFHNVNFDNFQFRYRRSIEHWYPQNRDAEQRLNEERKMDDFLLHSFGNLAIIVASQNSKFSDLDPLAKVGQWRDIFPNQSIKLQIMAEKTLVWNGWDNSRKKDIQNIDRLIIEQLKVYMNK